MLGLEWDGIMKRLISRVRAQKTKNRERQATRVGSSPPSLRESPFIGLFSGLLLWGATVFIFGMEDILRPDIGAAVALPLLGNAAFLFVGLCASALSLQIVRPGILRQNSTVLLLALISLISIIPAKALLYMASNTALIDPEAAAFLLPFAMAPMLATILTDSTLAIPVGVWTSFVMAMLIARCPTIACQSFPLFLTGMIATVVTAETAYRVKTRSRVAKTGIVIGVSEMTCVFGVTALRSVNPELSLVVYQAGACLISGFASAILVLMILPLFEQLFRVTTNITLLETSDLGHPLLQRLAIEAPGTYHHSLVVANLVQAAADEIGANSLLARVGAYFHDVGKLTKPAFFSENIKQEANPHDTLPPSMSTLVITSHVKEGLSLALLHKLPDSVLTIIGEHHGTTLLSCFHHKAKTQLEIELDGENAPPVNGKPKVNEEDFRYPGPKPSSPESAIVFLADAIEAASRSMEKTTASHIESLVQEITNIRVKDGQFDACSLTFSDLSKLKRSFVFTLTNMLHGRVPYPKDEN